MCFPKNTSLITNSVTLEPNLGTIISDGTKIQINNLGILTVGQRLTLTYQVQVAQPLTTGTKITNTAVVSSDQVIMPETATVVNTVTTSPAISLTKTGPLSATVGEVVVYSLTLRNEGNSLLDINLSDNMADAVSSSPVLGDENGDGWLGLNEIWVYTATYTIQPNDVSPMVNTATVSGTDGVGIIVTDTAQHSLFIDYQPKLNITKTGPLTSLVGSSVIYTFTVEHASSSDQSPINGLMVWDDIAGLGNLVSGDGILKWRRNLGLYSHLYHSGHQSQSPD